MKTKFILAFALCFVIAAAMAEAATLATGSNTFLIKPDQIFVVGDTAYLSLFVVSNMGPINFSTNITLLEGATNLNNFNVFGTTGNCDLFSCSYEGTWAFTINSLPVTYKAVITQINPDGTLGLNETLNATTKKDNDHDSYYSVASGGNDCDDNNANVHPGAPEVCGNGVDDDCTGGDAGCGNTDDGGHSSGGGGSGGGGSSTAARVFAETYSCLGNKMITIAPNDKIIFEYKDVNYTLFVKDVLPSSVIFKVYPIPSRTFQASKDKNNFFDLDWNNQYDFKMTMLGSHANVNANVTCDWIKETAVVNETKKEEKKPIVEEVKETLSNIKEGVLSIASEVVPKENASPVVGAVLALAIVAIGLLAYSLIRRRKKADEF